MNLGLLFLIVNTLGVINLSELDWITNHQSEFSRLDMALVIKIGRLMAVSYTHLTLPTSLAV